MATADHPNERIKDFLKPINIVSLLLGVAGLIAGYYFYIKSEKTPEISWSVSTQKIVDASKPLVGVSVVDGSGAAIKDNIYASEVTIWNSGTALLDSGDANSLIRYPLTLAAMKDTHLLHAVLSQTTKGEVPDHLVLEVHPPSVTASWSHLDPRAGFKVSLLSAGKSESHIGLAVKIAGLSEARFVRASPSMSEVFNDMMDDMWRVHTFLTVGAIALFASVVLAVTVYVALRFEHKVEAFLTHAKVASLLAFIIIYLGVLAIVASVSAGSLYVTVLQPRVPTEWGDVWQPATNDFGEPASGGVDLDDGASFEPSKGRHDTPGGDDLDKRKDNGTTYFGPSKRRHDTSRPRQ